MRNLQLLLAIAISLAAFSARANPTNGPQRMALLPRATGSNTIITANSEPTSGLGDPIEGQASPTETETQQTGSGGNSTRPTKKISSDAQPGGVVMQTPALLDGYQIYKIGQPVTFKWNYTSLQASPTAVNVEAYCTDGAAYFTIAGNISADTTEVIWDTEEYQASATAKLPVATYTLWIYDASKDRTAIPSPGYLYSFNLLQFGMYTPKAYTPIGEFVCPSCDSGAGILDPRTIRALLGMGFVTALTAVWFIAGVL